MGYEWNLDKNKINLEKHGISFEEACQIFKRDILTRVDDRKNYNETREISIGLLDEEIVIVVVHIDRKGITRIISARSANKTERRLYTMSISKKRLKEIKAIKEEDIDYSDIPELDETFWNNAVLVRPNKKERLTVRFDAEVVEWFKKQGRGYQTRMNTVLRSFYEAHKNEL